MKLLKAGAALAFSLGSAGAFAYPANVRHGYPNCTACHISPGGGGVLNAYGRALSLEVQSTKGSERESLFLYGVPKLPEWLDLGGDLRYIQIIQDTPSTIEGRGFWMQADAEAAVRIGKLTVDGAVGWKGNSETLASDRSVLSRRHFALYSVTDRMTLRAGKFYPTYGLMQPEHEDATRGPLGFNYGMESYNFEFSDQNENGSLFISPIFGKLRGDRKPDEKGFAVTKNFVFGGGNSRLGVSAIYGKGFYRTDYDSRTAFGPNVVWSLSKKIFWLAEVDFENRKPIGSGDATTGLYQYQKLSYEPVQGLILSGRQDLQRRKIGDGRTGAVTVGPVIDWYPRPHFDFQITLSRVYLPEGVPNFWIYTGMLHLYL